MGSILWDVDWVALLRPERSLLEMIIRGTIMYFVIVLVLRVAAKRLSGMIASTDILAIVLIAEIAGPGFTAGYRSVVEGAVLVATVMMWSYGIEWLVYRSPRFERFLDQPPVMLVKNGQMITRNMRAELVTRDELMAHLRNEGIADLSEVREARLETNGAISIIKRRADEAEPERAA